jgi:hypothetical protein
MLSGVHIWTLSGRPGRTFGRLWTTRRVKRASTVTSCRQRHVDIASVTEGDQSKELETAPNARGDP